MRKTLILLFILSITAPPETGADVARPSRADATTQSTALGDAFDRFWQAEDPDQAAAATAAIVATGAGFDQVFARLEAGRPYSRQVAAGRVDLSHRIDRVRHHYLVLVPEDYDPERRYRVVFYLHGGVAQPAWRKGGGWWSDYSRLEDPDRISVFPSSWKSSMWWQRRQAENLPAILDHLKRSYNLDENDVHMLGISDGATGAYFFAFRDPTPWASFLPFIGHPGVLGNRRVGADGEMYARNAFGKPFFVINGGQDRLYPVARVLPHLDLLHRAGAEIDFRPQMEAGHDTSWWPAEADNIRAFVGAHRRDPLPERLAWETEHADRYNRVHWLRIDELGAADGESELDDLNTLVPPPSMGIQPDPEPYSVGPPSGRCSVCPPSGERTEGVRLLKVHAGSVAADAGVAKGDVILELGGQPTPTTESLGQVLNAKGGWGSVLPAVIERCGQRLELTLRTPQTPAESQLAQAFPRAEPSGRVELARDGNTIRVRTQGVARYSLLLSPAELDFEQPITVITNGRESWRGRLEPDVATLLAWAARDNDRTMLFGAELEIALE